MKNKKISRIVTYLIIISVYISNFQYANRVIAVKADSTHIDRYVVVSSNKKVGKTISKIDENYDESEGKHQYIYCFEADESQLDNVEKLSNVTVSKDITVSACGGNNKTKKYRKNNKSKKIIEWNKKIINCIPKQKNQIDNKINVAVLDSGIDFSEDINVKESIDFVTEGNEYNIFSDITGHGTSVAGIIASSGKTEAVEGINENVNILSARILDENNNAPLSRVVEGIYWAIEKNAKIINISFGTLDDSEVLRKAIKDATDRGILVIAAAGNTGDKVQYPAAYEKVMAVGSVDSMGNITDFSADGKEVDVMAPGEDVKSVGAFGGSIIVSGTSISAPHVVGLASLLWAKDQTVSAEFIKALIIKSANRSKDEKSYKGIIDVKYALEIYDEYKKEYNKVAKDVQSSKEIDKMELVPENSNNIKVSENNYVSGTWTGDGHKKTAEYAGKFWDLTSVQIEILKLGIVYPDKQFAKMTVNPQWHTATVSNYNNYISNYRCATKIAFAVRKGKAVNTTNIKRPNDMAYADYKEMVKQVAGISWSKSLLGNHNVTNSHKGYFAMGMALHVITDSFAHQAYMYNSKSGKWEHLNHADDNCDDYTKEKYKNRFNCAKEAAKEALACFCDSDSEYGDHWEYVVNYKDFKLKRLKEYVTKQETYDSNMFGHMSIIEKGNKN